MYDRASAESTSRTRGRPRPVDFSVTLRSQFGFMFFMTVPGACVVGSFPVSRTNSRVATLVAGEKTTALRPISKFLSRCVNFIAYVYNIAITLFLVKRYFYKNRFFMIFHNSLEFLIDFFIISKISHTSFVSDL